MKRLVEGEVCGHGVRLYRPAGRWGRRGDYCLFCGWRCWRSGEELRWGRDRLPLEEVERLRGELGVQPLPEEVA